MLVNMRDLLADSPCQRLCRWLLLRCQYGDGAGCAASGRGTARPGDPPDCGGAAAPVAAGADRSLDGGRCRQASVPVAVHFDHGKTEKKIGQALELGFTSVMFDGSHLPLDENIAETCRIIEMALPLRCCRGGGDRLCRRFGGWL